MGISGFRGGLLGNYWGNFEINGGISEYYFLTNDQLSN